MNQNDEAAKKEEQDQIEESASETEMPRSESKNKIIPLSPQKTRLWEELLSKIVPWEKMTVSLSNFPYYINECSKSLLMECVTSRLKQSKLRKYHDSLTSSSDRILLQSISGTELYLERLVSAIALELQVPLLKLDDLDYDGEEVDSDDEIEVDVNESDAKGKGDTKVKLKKGDRVKYVGKAITIEEVNNRTLTSGQRGEVCEVNGDRVAVVFNICGLKANEADKDEKSTETFQQALVTWLNVKDVMKDLDARTHDFYIAMEVLYGVLESQHPMIVYFPDSFSWPSMKTYTYKQLPKKEKNILNRYQEGVVMICAQLKSESGSEDKQKFEHTWRPFEFPRGSQEHDKCKLFKNVVSIKPPEDQDLLSKFNKQIEEDKPTVISQGNLSTLHKVLKAHNLLCTNLEHANIEDMTLTREKAEKIVGWATNHYFSSCPFPCVEDEKLHIPDESIKLAILRLKEEEEAESKKKSKNIKALASNRHERGLISAVICPEDIGVKFDDVGALENVKKLLHETVILPMRRPELFSHGNLLKPCKGLLLFGPPGTGKTLIAKALATESGANFINVTTATITSMWLGETENLTRALFSYATKLAPAIIFVDEVDSMLGVRGSNVHATSRLNEFMAAWDGLTSKESRQVLVIGATNRPFDLDEAVIRRMPRRIYVGLPDVENRCKILKVLLKNENLESGFSIEELAQETAGYSGSDLKNICVAAAYRPIEELLQQESKVSQQESKVSQQESKVQKSDAVPAPALRPLNLNDFILCKSKVRPSVSRNSESIIQLKKWDKQYGEGESQNNKVN